MLSKELKINHRVLVMVPGKRTSVERIIGIKETATGEKIFLTARGAVSVSDIKRKLSN